MSASAINVLLVEDNPGDIQLIREMLAAAGDDQFTFEHTDRLATGLTRLAGGGVDVLLLDLGLPDTVGLETFTKAYAQAEHVPIIVLTDHGDEALAVRAVQEGAQDHLGKGEIDGRLLTRSIRHAVERKREHRQLYLQAAALSVARDAIMITDCFGRM